MGSAVGRFTRAAVAVTVAAVAVAGAARYVHSLIPDVPRLPAVPRPAAGPTKTEVDVAHLKAALAGRPGVAAGEVTWSGINVRHEQQQWKHVPKWVAGACATMTDAAGKATYQSRFGDGYPAVAASAGGGYQVTIPEPAAVQVGITVYPKPKRVDSWKCGLLATGDIDVQAMNRAVQGQLCGLAKSKTGDPALEDKARASVLALLKPTGVKGVTVKFARTAATDPPECKGA